MSVTIKFPSKPNEEEVKKFDKAVEKFSGIAHKTVYQVEDLIRKAKTPLEILTCKYISQYRHGETMKLIRKKEREIKKKQKESK